MQKFGFRKSGKNWNCSIFLFFTCLGIKLMNEETYTLQSCVPPSQRIGKKTSTRWMKNNNLIFYHKKWCAGLHTFFLQISTYHIIPNLATTIYCSVSPPSDSIGLAPQGMLMQSLKCSNPSKDKRTQLLPSRMKGYL